MLAKTSNKNVSNRISLALMLSYLRKSRRCICGWKAPKSVPPGASIFVKLKELTVCFLPKRCDRSVSLARVTKAAINLMYA